MENFKEIIIKARREAYFDTIQLRDNLKNFFSHVIITSESVEIRILISQLNENQQSIINKIAQNKFIEIVYL